MLYQDTAVILAGGNSSRMGFDKQFLPIGNQTIVGLQIEKLREVFREIIVVTNQPEKYKGYDCKTVEDQWKGFGPLGGIHGGLVSSGSLYNYVIACDMPYIHLDYIRYMKEIIGGCSQEKDGVITRFGEWLEPFNGFYHRRLIPKMEQNMRKGQRKIHEVLKAAEILYIEEGIARQFSPGWEMFMNLNTAEDIERYGIDRRKEKK